MTRNEFIRRFPRASASAISANCAEDSGKVAVVERDPGNGAVGKIQVQAAVGGKFLVRVTSVRKRLLDEDNICEKFAVDCCRHAGLIPTDAPGKTKIETSQRKAEKDEQEHTEIIIQQIQ